MSRPNPKHEKQFADELLRIINEEIGEEVWNVSDISILTHWLADRAERNGEEFIKGVSARMINKLLLNDPRLFGLAAEGRVGLAPQTPKGKDPEWFTKLPDTSVVDHQVKKGKARDWIEASILKKAKNISDKSARSAYVTLMTSMLNMNATSSWGKKMGHAGAINQQSFGLSVAYSEKTEALLASEARLKRIETRLDNNDAVVSRLLIESPRNRRPAVE
jgi:hypothetical protein